MGSGKGVWKLGKMLGCSEWRWKRKKGEGGDLDWNKRWDEKVRKYKKDDMESEGKNLINVVDIWYEKRRYYI